MVLQLLVLSLLLMFVEPSHEYLFTILRKTYLNITKRKTRKKEKYIAKIKQFYLYTYFVEFAIDLKSFRNKGRIMLLYQLTIWIDHDL